MKIRICVISTTAMLHPPVGYSGLEMLAWQQAEGLKARGHTVTLVAPRGSKTTCDLHETTLGESEQLAYSGYRHKLKDYDCVIDNSWNKWAYIAKMEGQCQAPILGVMHSVINTMYNNPPPVEKPCLVCISKDQATQCKERLKVEAKVAQNGVDINFYKSLNKKRNGRYLFLARFSSIKSPDIACNVCKNCKVGLDLVGDDRLTAEPEFVKSIRNTCALTPGFRYIGPQSRSDCVNWFNTNKALLHPTFTWPEPFGLSPIESQLCGTPVIAANFGALSETVKHGESGFLVNSPQEMEEIIKSDAVSSINPKRCREWAASQFSFENMIARYSTLCEEAIRGGW